ncbi:hypothetical protein VP01_3746g1 [Puccinia sorghi]|uniref:Uncharacterized protein n=1 Tax=Puccinia sorghi TaxID=27349 RepID=A0A0L6UUQ2_9BASI|nr:hypothetical protein VP01_3746g1 [Puccinia sorghi]
MHITMLFPFKTDWSCRILGPRKFNTTRSNPKGDWVSVGNVNKVSGVGNVLYPSHEVFSQGPSCQYVGFYVQILNTIIALNQNTKPIKSQQPGTMLPDEAGSCSCLFMINFLFFSKNKSSTKAYEVKMRHEFYDICIKNPCMLIRPTPCGGLSRNIWEYFFFPSNEQQGFFHDCEAEMTVFSHVLLLNTFYTIYKFCVAVVLLRNVTPIPIWTALPSPLQELNLNYGDQHVQYIPNSWDLCTSTTSELDELIQINMSQVVTQNRAKNVPRLCEFWDHFWHEVYWMLVVSSMYVWLEEDGKCSGSDPSLKIIISSPFRLLNGRYIATQHKNLINKNDYRTIKISREDLAWHVPSQRCFHSLNLKLLSAHILINLSSTFLSITFM